jgi:hypothetical protein
VWIANKGEYLMHCTTTSALDHVIDCDAAPSNPWEKMGVTVEEHKKGGSLRLDSSQIRLLLHEKQRKGSSIEGYKLRDALRGEAVLNANVLDDWIKNPHLIPEDLKKKTGDNFTYLYFWGTIFRFPEGLRVRYLYWFNERAWAHYSRLTDGWTHISPAVLHAS